ncbi:MAG TPA: glycosyltransferase family 1 protein [Actinomycetes bacterium]|nr:glycosyltransferase family 1 protein [Actinomycetes bacterium]
MRVGIDATPLLGPRTGVGQYTAGLVEGLQALAGGPELVLVPFTWRGARDLPAAVALGPRASAGRRRVPARALQAAWARLEVPPVEWLAGRLDCFHATNFVAPPARRARVAVTVHDLTFRTHPELVTPASARYRRLVPRSLARAAVVCVPTAAVAAELADAYGVVPDRLVVTPLGVRDAYRRAAAPPAAWLARRGLPSGYVLFAGSREPRKNLPVLLDAYRELLAQGAGPPPLVLAGPAGWGPALDLAGLPAGMVVTAGYLADDELARVTAGAAALAFPSAVEGFGLPPLEALACGVPVVASDLPALREVLGPHAAFAPAGDAAALAAALAKTLAAEPDEAAAGARRAHAARFTWRACAEATLAAYRRAVAA